MNRHIWNLKCETVGDPSVIKKMAVKQVGPVPVGRRKRIRITLPPVEVDFGALEKRMIWTASSSQDCNDILLPEASIALALAYGTGLQLTQELSPD